MLLGRLGHDTEQRCSSKRKTYDAISRPNKRARSGLNARFTQMLDSVSTSALNLGVAAASSKATSAFIERISKVAPSSASENTTGYVTDPLPSWLSETISSLERSEPFSVIDEETAAPFRLSSPFAPNTPHDLALADVHGTGPYIGFVPFQSPGPLRGRARTRSSPLSPTSLAPAQRSKVHTEVFGNIQIPADLKSDKIRALEEQRPGKLNCGHDRMSTDRYTAKLLALARQSTTNDYDKDISIGSATPPIYLQTNLFEQVSTDDELFATSQGLGLNAPLNVDSGLSYGVSLPLFEHHISNSLDDHYSEHHSARYTPAPLGHSKAQFARLRTQSSDFYECDRPYQRSGSKVSAVSGDGLDEMEAELDDIPTLKTITQPLVDLDRFVSVPGVPQNPFESNRHKTSPPCPFPLPSPVSLPKRQQLTSSTLALMTPNSELHSMSVQSPAHNQDVPSVRQSYPDVVLHQPRPFQLSYGTQLRLLASSDDDRREVTGFGHSRTISLPLHSRPSYRAHNKGEKSWAFFAGYPDSDLEARLENSPCPTERVFIGDRLDTTRHFS